MDAHGEWWTIAQLRAECADKHEQLRANLWAMTRKSQVQVPYRPRKDDRAAQHREGSLGSARTSEEEVERAFQGEAGCDRARMRERALAQGGADGRFRVIAHLHLDSGP